MDFNPRNLILLQLEPAVAMRARGRFEKLELRLGEVLQETGEPVQSVWFPDTALLCIASENADGECISGGMVGSSGAFGAFEACGSRLSFTRAVVGIGGAAWRMTAQHYRQLFETSPRLRTAIHKHIEALMVEARQSVACAAIHAVESRMCRTLLEASTRCDGRSVLSLTQDALASLLGVQRATVALTVSDLQRRGIIRTGRGSLELLDLAGLEAACCSCRDAIAIAEAEIFSTQRSGLQSLS